MADATQVWPVGTRKQLLFDRRFVESSAGLQFTVNPPLQRTPIKCRPSPVCAPATTTLRYSMSTVVSGVPLPPASTGPR